MNIIDKKIIEEIYRIKDSVEEINELKKTALLDITSVEYQSTFMKYLKPFCVQTPFGQKIMLEIIDKQKYYDLQAARGVPFLNKSPEEFVKGIDNKIDYQDVDTVRLDEINLLNFRKDINILEFGVRGGNFLLRLQEHGFTNCYGLDCVKLNALYCEKRGLNTIHCDATEANRYFKNNDFDLVIMYHVLEHIPKPIEALNVAYDLLKNNGILHIEVPIEYNPPNVRYAHCYNFVDQELAYLLNQAKFRITYTSKYTPVGGKIERYLAKKIQQIL